MTQDSVVPTPAEEEEEAEAVSVELSSPDSLRAGASLEGTVVLNLTQRFSAFSDKF